MHLKSKKALGAQFTRRRIVHVKLSGQNSVRRIERIEELSTLSQDERFIAFPPSIS